MPRAKRVHCRVCERHIDECGPLSARGKCEDCGLQLQTEAVTQMFSGQGATFDKWAANTTAGLRRHLQRSQRVDE